MHLGTATIALGLTLAATTGAVPLSKPAPTVHPLFAVVSQGHASAATGVANVPGREVPEHEHTPNCEHAYNAKSNSTTHQANRTSTEAKGHATEGMNHTAKVVGNPSAYPGFKASPYGEPHAVQVHNHTGYACAHRSHHNGTSPAGHGYDKKAMMPKPADSTACSGAGCEDSTVVTAKVDSADVWRRTTAKDSKRTVQGQDSEFSYEDVALEMSGARIAGGT